MNKIFNNEELVLFTQSDTKLTSHTNIYSKQFRMVTVAVVTLSSELALQAFVAWARKWNLNLRVF